MGSSSKIRQMDMGFTLIHKETDMNLKTTKTRRTQDSFEVNYMEEAKSNLKMEISISETFEMVNAQDGVKWFTRTLKQRLKLLTLEFMKGFGREAKETVKEKCHGLMDLYLKGNGSLTKGLTEQ